MLPFLKSPVALGSGPHGATCWSPVGETRGSGLFRAFGWPPGSRARAGLEGGLGPGSLTWAVEACRLLSRFRAMTRSAFVHVAFSKPQKSDTPHIRWVLGPAPPGAACGAREADTGPGAAAQGTLARGPLRYLVGDTLLPSNHLLPVTYDQVSGSWQGSAGRLSCLI